MRLGDYFRLAWKALWERRGRTVGTIAGIAIAIIALGLAMGFAQGYGELTMSFFTRVFGINTIFVIPAQGQALTIADTLIASTLPHVSKVVPLMLTYVTLKIGGYTKVAYLIATSEDVLRQLFGVVSLKDAVEKGTPILRPGLALVGHDIAFNEAGEELIFPQQPLPLVIGGKTITLTVSGILKKTGAGFIHINPNMAIFIDETTYLTMVNPSGQIAGMIVYTDSPLTVNYVMSQLKVLYPNCRVFSLQTLITNIARFMSLVELFLVSVSAISFVIIGIWMFDTMTISVVQRMREFGIMRAVGFSGRSIPLLLIIEAMSCTLIGVAIGLLILAILDKFVLPTPEDVLKIWSGGFQAILPFRLYPLNYLFIASMPFIANVIATLAPAYRASKVPPAQVLRYE